MLAVSNTYYASYYLGNVKFLACMTAATYALEIFVIILIPKFSRQHGYKRLFTTDLIMADSGLKLSLRIIDELVPALLMIIGRNYHGLLHS